MIYRRRSACCVPCGCCSRGMARRGCGFIALLLPRRAAAAGQPLWASTPPRRSTRHSLAAWPAALQLHTVAPLHAPSPGEKAARRGRAKGGERAGRKRGAAVGGGAAAGAREDAAAASRCFANPPGGGGAAAAAAAGGGAAAAEVRPIVDGGIAAPGEVDEGSVSLLFTDDRRTIVRCAATDRCASGALILCAEAGGRVSAGARRSARWRKLRCGSGSH